jgi:signal transduction histidine kinase
MLAPIEGGRERAAPALRDPAREAFSVEGPATSLALRRPLDVIIAHAATLLTDAREALPEEARRLVFAIGERALDLDRMLDGLGRIAALAQLPSRCDRFPLVEAVDEAWAELAPLRRGRDATLELGALPIVTGDRLLLRQALAALLGNALRFTRPRATARVEVAGVRRSGALVCAVRDNGVGFDPARANGLFRPFARLGQHAALEGEGLGLALVDAIVRRHGGRAWATGRRGAGAEFFFSLPSE